MQPPADITLQVLERIQQSIVDLRDETRAGLAELGTRLDGVDTTLAEHGAILCVLQDHASATNEHLASLDHRATSLEHHASTIATEGRARLEASITTHEARLTRVEARLDAGE